jgi:hypothetical protein
MPEHEPIRFLARLFHTTVVLSACFLSNASLAESDQQLWTVATITGAVKKSRPKIRYYAEFQPRLGNDWQTWERVIARTALGYKLDSGLTLWGGYAYLPSLADSEFNYNYSPESRIWQMATYNQKATNTDFGHRAILEQRFIDKAADEVAHRLRYRLKISEPLTVMSNKLTLGWALANELMVNLNSIDSGPQTGFDRNRLSTGPYLQRGAWRGDISYMWEASESPGPKDRELHALVLSTSWNFD